MSIAWVKAMGRKRDDRPTMHLAARAEGRLNGPSDYDDMSTRKGGYSVILTGLLFVLLTIGAFNLYSASSGEALFYTQLKHIPIGVFVFFVCGWLVKPRHLASYAYVIFGLTCLALAAVLLSGSIGGGSRRWLEFGGLRAQPSELAKITVAIVAARFFSQYGLKVQYDLRDLWPLALLVGSLSGLIFPQPDLGTAGFLCIIVAVQTCFVRIRWQSLAILFAGFVITAPLVWTFGLHDYQKYRVLTFLDPAMDPQGKGYNSLQSLVAIGSGGISGKGFMNGTQTHLKFLPMSHSDFIFSVFAEEHGFIGCIALFLMFAALAYLALEIARQAQKDFNTILAVGLGAFLFCEFTINVAMVLRMFPVKGLPLPFMSYGGSHLLTSCAVLGLLVAVDRENRLRFGKPANEVYKN